MFSRMPLMLTGVCAFILHTHMWVQCRGQHAACIQLSGSHSHIYACVLKQADALWIAIALHTYTDIFGLMCVSLNQMCVMCVFLSYWHLNFQLDFLNRQLKLIPWTLTNLVVHVGKCVSASMNLHVSLCDDKTQESKYYSSVRD